MLPLILHKTPSFHLVRHSDDHTCWSSLTIRPYQSYEREAPKSQIVTCGETMNNSQNTDNPWGAQKCGLFLWKRWAQTCSSHSAIQHYQLNDSLKTTLSTEDIKREPDRIGYSRMKQNISMKVFSHPGDVSLLEDILCLIQQASSVVKDWSVCFLKTPSEKWSKQKK